MILAKTDSFACWKTDRVSADTEQEQGMIQAKMNDTETWWTKDKVSAWKAAATERGRYKAFEEEAAMRAISPEETAKWCHGDEWNEFRAGYVHNEWFAYKQAQTYWEWRLVGHKNVKRIEVEWAAASARWADREGRAARVWTALNTPPPA